MCRAVRCRTCSKTTWAGCGAHVSQVKATVPDDQWCPGHPKGEGPQRVSLLRRVFGQGGRNQ